MAGAVTTGGEDNPVLKRRLKGDWRAYGKKSIQVQSPNSDGLPECYFQSEVSRNVHLVG